MFLCEIDPANSSILGLERGCSDERQWLAGEAERLPAASCWLLPAQLPCRRPGTRPLGSSLCPRHLPRLHGRMSGCGSSGLQHRPHLQGRMSGCGAPAIHPLRRSWRRRTAGFCPVGLRGDISYYSGRSGLPSVCQTPRPASSSRSRARCSTLRIGGRWRVG